MVRIRLRRTGLKNQSTYRIMAADKESPRDGRFLEILGDYNPRTHPATIRVHEDRIYDWLQKGAQPSESALKVFNSIGLMDRYARFKAGESIEKLLEEAKSASSKKADAPAPVKGMSKKAAAKAKAEEKQAEAAKPSVETKQESAAVAAEGKPTEESKAEVAEAEAKPVEESKAEVAEAEAKPVEESKPEVAEAEEKPAE